VYNSYFSLKFDQILDGFNEVSIVRNEYGGLDIEMGGDVEGTEFDDRIDGGDGNDRLMGEGGADILTGGAGNDHLIDGIGFDNDYLDGGDDDDIFWIYGGHDIVIGGAGDDVFVPHAFNPFRSTLYAEIFGGEGLDSLALEQMNSWEWQYEWMQDGRLLMTDGGGRRLALDGVETLYFMDMQVDLSNANALDGVAFQENTDGSGSFGNDDLSGTGNLFGLSGNDVIRGSDFVDQIYGGVGNDDLYGGGSGDVLDGGEGRNRLYGEEGNDIFVDTGGENIAFGGEGNDEFIALSNDTGFDRYIGGTGEDVVTYDGTNFFDVTISINSRGVITVTHDNGSVDFLHSIEEINFEHFPTVFVDNLPNIIDNHINEIVLGSDDYDLVMLNGMETSVQTLGGNDIVYAYEGSSHVHLGSGQDTIYAGYSDGLNDLFSGASGTDVVIYDVDFYAGHFSDDFALSLTPRGNLRIHDPDGGIDTLFGVEYFAFESVDGSIEQFDVQAHIDFLSQGQFNTWASVELSSINLLSFDDLDVAQEPTHIEQAVEHSPIYFADDFEMFSGVLAPDELDFLSHDVLV